MRQKIFLCIMLLSFAANAHAEIFYKDNPTPSVTSVSDKNDKNQIDCQRSKSKSCQATNKPMQFTAFGDCQTISTRSGRGVFIPARSKKEWANFKSWAQKNPQIVTMDSCHNPQWTAWSACSNVCGTGTQTRQCNRPSCVGEASQACSDFSGCACGPLEKRAIFCEGQDANFTEAPPAVSYVDFEKCDHQTPCQARCPMGDVAIEDGSGCKTLSGE